MASAILQCKIRKLGRGVIFATDRLTFLVMPWQSRLIKPVDPSFQHFSKSRRNMLQIMKDAWIRTLIALDVRDPLKRTDAPYVFPEDCSELQPEARLRATICDLFANLRQPIEDIARDYEMTPNQVVSVLIEEGLIKDQRRNRVAPIKGGRRQVDR